jgi:DNA-binding MarR family transcriptional regulator
MAKRPTEKPQKRFDRRDSLGYQVNHLARLFARALSRRLAKHDVALGQFPLLLILWEEENLNQSEIAKRLEIEQPTVANTLTRMERDGLVETAPDPSNRRQARVKLTGKGRRLERPLTAEARAVNAAAAAGLSATEIEAFHRAIGALKQGLAREGPHSGLSENTNKPLPA